MKWLIEIAEGAAVALGGICFVILWTPPSSISFIVRFGARVAGNDCRPVDGCQTCYEIAPSAWDNLRADG